MRYTVLLNVSQQQLPTIDASCNSVHILPVMWATVVKDREIQENPASNSPVTQAQTYNFPLVYLWAQQLFFHFEDLCHKGHKNMTCKYQSRLYWCLSSQNGFSLAIYACHSSRLLSLMQSFIWSRKKNTWNHYMSFMHTTNHYRMHCMLSLNLTAWSFFSAKNLHKRSPVKCCMCNGESDRNRKLSQDWKVITFLQKMKGVLWFPNFAVDLPFVHDIHIAEISEMSGNLT